MSNNSNRGPRIDASRANELVKQAAELAESRNNEFVSVDHLTIVCMEDEVLRNTTELVIEKNRPFSKLGSAGSLYYDPETTILREHF